MYEFQKEKLNHQLVESLIHLSKVWVDEDNCYGMIENDSNEFIDKIIYTAYDKDQLVGYLFGHIDVHEKEPSAIKKDSKIFEVDELYIIKTHRSKGIGKDLFHFASDDLKDKIDYMTLTTSNKQSDRILHFYLDELGMDFWSARFFKKIG